MNIPDIHELEKLEKQRLAGRIRGFCWSSALRLKGHELFGAAFLAVTNDADDIIFIELRKPTDEEADRNCKWSPEVIHRYHYEGEKGMLAIEPGSLLMDTMVIRGLGHISWSPWDYQPPAVGKLPSSSDANVASSYISFLGGTTLKVIKLEAALRHPQPDEHNGHIPTDEVPSDEPKLTQGTTGHPYVTLSTYHIYLSARNDFSQTQSFSGPLRWKSNVCMEDNFYLIIILSIVAGHRR